MDQKGEERIIWKKTYDKASRLNLIHIFICLTIVCGFPLGVNNGELLSDSFTASSYGMSNEPWNARLNRLIGNGSWCAEKNITGEYLQIDLKHSKMLTGISTQGKHDKDGKWVTEYSLYYWEKEGLTPQPQTVNGSTKVSSQMNSYFSCS